MRLFFSFPYRHLKGLEATETEDRLGATDCLQRRREDGMHIKTLHSGVMLKAPWGLSYHRS
jgi:hypothetical protein